MLFIPYGDGEEELGTALGGDMGGLDLGPEYGAQAPDGSWWILDAAKRRLAHYSETGEYLGAVAMKLPSVSTWAEADRAGETLS